MSTCKTELKTYNLEPQLGWKHREAGGTLLYGMFQQSKRITRVFSHDNEGGIVRC